MTTPAIFNYLERYKTNIEAVLPGNMSVNRMLQLLRSELRKSPALLQCEPSSLFSAILQCSQLGLEPDALLGEAYFIPFRNNKTNTTHCNLIIGYKGLMTLALRSKRILQVEAHAVYERDLFEYTRGTEQTLLHKPHIADRGQIIAFYAMARLRDVAPLQFEVMTKREVDEVKKQSRASGDGPWVTHYEAMGRKTVLRRLFNFLPRSTLINRALVLDTEADIGAQTIVDIVPEAEETMERYAEQKKEKPKRTPKQFKQRVQQQLLSGEQQESADGKPDEESLFKQLKASKTIEDLHNAIALTAGISAARKEEWHAVAKEVRNEIQARYAMTDVQEDLKDEQSKAGSPEQTPGS